MINDERLKAAAEEVAKAILDALPEDDSIQYTPSPAFERKMKRLLQREKNPVLYYSMRSVASILVMILLGCLLLFGVSQDVRAAVIGWFKELRGETHFEYEYEGNSAVDMTGVRYETRWVPQGLELVLEDVDDHGGMYVYSDGSEYVTQLMYIIASDSGDAKLLMDGHELHYECEYIKVLDHDAELYMSKSDEYTNALVWSNEKNTLFYMTGNLAKEDMVKWAESIIEIRE